MSRRSEQILLFTAFREAGVEYVVVGGVAVNAHGFPRNTRDLDVFIRSTEENARAVFRALQVFGAPLEDMNPTDLLIDDAHYQVRTEHGRIDVLTSIGEMPFAQAWQNRVQAEVDGVPVQFISKQDLIENKRQVGRTIDLADVEELSRLPDRETPQLDLEE